MENLSATIGYTDWEEALVETLKGYVPFKTKVIRGNHQPFITKGLRKTIT